jgi:hypothetical protein
MSNCKLIGFNVEIFKNAIKSQTLGMTSLRVAVLPKQMLLLKERNIKLVIPTGAKRSGGTCSCQFSHISSHLFTRILSEKKTSIPPQDSMGAPGSRATARTWVYDTRAKPFLVLVSLNQERLDPAPPFQLPAESCGRSRPEKAVACSRSRRAA